MLAHHVASSRADIKARITESVKRYEVAIDAEAAAWDASKSRTCPTWITARDALRNAQDNMNSWYKELDRFDKFVVATTKLC